MGEAPVPSTARALAVAMGGGPAARPQRSLGRAVEQSGIGGVSSSSSFTNGCYLNLQIPKQADDDPPQGDGAPALGDDAPAMGDGPSLSGRCHIM
ncbi:unnamed protein product [Urochloa humidicola]